MPNLVNISIDDVSPHPKSSTNVLNRCFEIIDVFPEVKFSLFIPISYWRTIKPQIATQNPLQINLFPDFCEEISKLPSKNFEICYHGYYHGIPKKSDNDEFQNLNYKDAIDRFAAMFEVTKLANLDKQFKNIFRPPAWRMSPDAIKAARDVGFNLLALSPDDYAKKTYNKEECLKNDVVYYNCAPPLKSLAIYKKTEIVYHACEWDKNYLCTNKTHSLINFLKKNKGIIEFQFLEGLL